MTVHKFELPGRYVTYDDRYNEVCISDDTYMYVSLYPDDVQKIYHWLQRTVKPKLLHENQGLTDREK